VTVCRIAILAALFILTAADHAGAQEERIPALLSPEQIKLEEFEPAVRDQVTKAYEEARQVPQNARAVGRLGMLLQVYGRYELARACYLRARELDRTTSRWSYYLGLVEKTLGQNDQALSHIRDALSIDPAYAPAQIRLAQLLFDSGQADESVAIYQALIAQNGNLATAHFGLGQILAARSDWTGAIAEYRKACEIHENYAAAQYALGMAYRNAGDMAKAKEHLQRYQVVKQVKQPSEDPMMDDINGLYSGGLTRFATGSTFFREGKTVEAIKEFEGALEVNPRLVMAHINLIALYGQLNQPEKAEQHFKAAVELDPGWVESYFNWGFFLAQHGRKTEAVAQFQKVIEINPNYTEARVQLGILLDDAGQASEAVAQLQRAIDTAPGHRQAHYFLGRSLLRLGKTQEAIQHLLQTTQVEDSWTPVCMQAVAIAYERAGDKDQAKHFLQEAKKRAVVLKMQPLAAQLQGELDRLSARRP
jgi:tetratricopeptide (TPR) repeat protein